MDCPECGSKMKNLGNTDGVVYTSYPVQWDDTYVCDKCKIKAKKREFGSRSPDLSYLEDYKDYRNY